MKRFLLACLISSGAMAQGGPPQIKPLPFVPRPVSARLVSPVVNTLLVSVVVAPANAARHGFMLWNNSANSEYCCYAATCTSASPTRIVATFTTWDASLAPVVYQGPISCLRNSGSGGTAVWELE